MKINIKNVEVVKYNPYGTFDPNNYVTGPLIKRNKMILSFNPVTKEINGSVNILENPEHKTSCLYYDDEAVYEFKDYYFLNLACQSCNEPFYYKSKMKVHSVVIDRVNHMLYVLKDQNELYNFLSGKYFQKIYSKRLNSFTNISLPTIKKGRNETYRNTTIKRNLVYNEAKGRYEPEDPLHLFQVKLIYNRRSDIFKYNNSQTLTRTTKKFTPDVAVYSCYKFSSAHETKIRLFKDIIEEVTGYKILY